MIEEVEELGSKLQVHPFGKLELTSERQIYLPHGEPSQRIAN
jgi:hypothetical protein